MTDLTDFGVDIEPDDQEDDDQPSSRSGYGATHYYRRGRCRAIKRDGTRCRAPAGGGRGDCCHTHAMESDPVTIDDGPRDLIEATTRTLWANLENQHVRSAVRSLDYASREGSKDA